MEPIELIDNVESDRVLAELLGWTDLKRYYERWPNLTAPEGGGIFTGLRPDHKHDEDYLVVPRFTHKVDDALLLPISDDVYWQVAIMADGRTDAYLEQHVGRRLAYDWSEPILSAPRPALAMCRAWLAWRQAVDGGES